MLHSGPGLFLAHATVRPPLLCEDVRRLIYHHVHHRYCARCGTLVGTRRRLFACFQGGESLCFYCGHRARWPYAAP